MQARKQAKEQHNYFVGAKSTFSQNINSFTLHSKEILKRNIHMQNVLHFPCFG